MSAERASASNRYECNRPHIPEMSRLSQRIRTFELWPNQRGATPRSIAKAGFYYLGNGDRVTCFYCKGVLQDWAESYHPWEEHAKWFPTCGYVIRTKGPSYVARIQRIHQGPLSRTDNVEHPESSRLSNLGAGETLPGRIEERDEHLRWICDQAKKMGFSATSIAVVVERNQQESGEGYTSLESLVCDLIRYETLLPDPNNDAAPPIQRPRPRQAQMPNNFNSANVARTRPIRVSTRTSHARTSSGLRLRVDLSLDGIDFLCLIFTCLFLCFAFALAFIANFGGFV